MSLEATLNTTNELLTKLIGILTTGMEAEAAMGAAEVKPKRGRPAKAAADAAGDALQKSEATPVAATPAAPEAVTKSAEAPLGLLPGDPVGTRYFVIAAHNSVYVQRPGDPDCTVSGAEIVTAELYAAKKAEFAAMTQAILDKQKVGNEPPAAAAPAPSSTASTTSSPAPAPSVPFPAVVEKLQALMRSNDPAHGRQAVVGILKQFLPNETAPTVPKLESVGKNAEIIAAVDALMSAEPDLGI